MMLLLVLIGTVAGKTLQSCGANGDLFTDVKLGLFPDPPTANGMATITMTGLLTEEFNQGSVHVNGTVTVLRSVKIPFAASAKIDIVPGVPKGPISMKIGPFKWPSQPKYLHLAVDGQLILNDPSGKQIACFEANNMPVTGPMSAAAAAAAEASLTAASFATRRLADGPVENCGTDDDHLKDLKYEIDHGSISINGTLDEDISEANLHLEVDATIPLAFDKLRLPIPDLSIHYALNGPIKFSPARKAGFVGFMISDMTPGNEIFAGAKDGIKAHIKYDATDANNEEIFCVKVDYSG